MGPVGCLTLRRVTRQALRSRRGDWGGGAEEEGEGRARVVMSFSSKYSTRIENHQRCRRRGFSLALELDLSAAEYGSTSKKGRLVCSE